jgi:hypothetical protein
MSETGKSTWERIAEALANDLRASRGNPDRERASLARALASYARAHSAAGEPPFEYATHFFAVDGRVLDFVVTPAFSRVEADADTRARWIKTLDALPRRLDQLDAIGSTAVAKRES